MDFHENDSNMENVMKMCEETLTQGVKVVSLGRQNERNMGYGLCQSGEPFPGLKWLNGNCCVRGD